MANLQSIPRVSPYLPQGNFRPTLFSKYMQAVYLGTNLVPKIASHDWEGDLSKVGDRVVIRKRPAVEVFDYAIGQDLERQSALADDAITLYIAFANYFNIPINDVERFQSDIDFQAELLDEGSRALSTKVERRVLQSAYVDAGNTANVTLATDVATSAKAILNGLLVAATQLNEKNVPDDAGSRWAIIDPRSAYYLFGSDLKAAYLTGNSNTTLQTAKIQYPVAGFDVYVSNNLDVNYTTGAAHMLAGHTDAISFAGQISTSETIRNQNDFGDLIRSMIAYGYRVTRPEALVHINASGAGLQALLTA